jgi:hypothetical protein
LRAGAPAARLLAAPAPGPPPPRQASAQEYAEFIEALPIAPAYRRQRLAARRRFVERYPDLAAWYAEPLAARVGRLPGEARPAPSARLSYQARGYLVFLGLRGHARLDWDRLLAVPQLYVCELARQLGLELGVQGLLEDAVRLGYERRSAHQALRWAVGRLALRAGDPDLERVGADRLTGLAEAARRFAGRPDVGRFYGSAERYRQRATRSITAVHLLEVLLYHRGQLAQQPRKLMPR